MLKQALLIIGIVALYTVTLLHFSRSGSPANGDYKRQRDKEVMSEKSDTDADVRRAKIVEMTQHVWQGYMQHAAGADELKPVSNSFANNWGGIGVTPVDSLDTLLLMGLSQEFREAKQLALNVDLSRTTARLSFFETVIRHIGGALSTYAATNDTAFLDFAQRVADGLAVAFEDSPFSFPAHKVKFGATNASQNFFLGGRKRYILAEISSFQMEYRYLSYALKDDKYAALARNVNRFFVDIQKKGWPHNKDLYVEGEFVLPHRGLFPTFFTPEGKGSGAAGLGGMMDSYYEYLLKQWIQFGKKDTELLDLYEDAVEGILQHLLKYSDHMHYAILGMYGKGFHSYMDHLSCFAPGMLILGVMHGAHDERPGRPHRSFSVRDVVDAAVDLTATCYRMYLHSPLGLSPESVEFFANGTFSALNHKYILRPEVVESLFYLYRFTHDERYRDWGWQIAEAINRHSRTSSGFSAIQDSQSAAGEKVDSMESFFIAETLKYLYLLFSDDSVLPLDRWVLTTEAHPLPIIP